MDAGTGLLLRRHRYHVELTFLDVLESAFWPNLKQICQPKIQHWHHEVEIGLLQLPMHKKPKQKVSTCALLLNQQYMLATC